MRRKRERSLIVATVLAVLGLPGAAFAFSVNDFVLSDAAGLTPLAYFDFTPITSNGDQTNIDLGLAVSLANIDGFDRMFFEFVNESTNPNELSSVKTIYFETTGLSGTNAYVAGTDPGVGFSVGSTGGGNQGFPFSVNHDLDAAADPPPSTSGINPGESLLLGYTFTADPSAVYESLTNGDWGIGLHIIATAPNANQSEKYIASFLPGGPPLTPVPEPSTLVLLGMGSAFLVARLRFA